MKLLLATLCVVALTGAAVAQEGATAPTPAVEAAKACTAPAPPTPYSPAALPAKPATPKCVNVAKSTMTCSNNVFAKWQEELKAHNNLRKARADEVNAYTREVVKWQRAATDYAECEGDRAQEFFPE